MRILRLSTAFFDGNGEIRTVQLTGGTGTGGTGTGELFLDCQSLFINQDAGFDMAGNQHRRGSGKGDTKRIGDGSCQSLFTNQDAEFDMAGNQHRRGGGKGDPKRDGSCLLG